MKISLIILAVIGMILLCGMVKAQVRVSDTQGILDVASGNKLYTKADICSISSIIDLKNINCDKVCILGTDCSGVFLTAFQKINNTKSASIKIAEGEYYFASSNSYKLNISELTIEATGAKLIATTDGITVLGLGPINASTDKIKYNINGLTVDMNNLADVGLNLINPSKSRITNINVLNRTGESRHWMFNLWCQVDNDFCENNNIAGLNIENSNTTTWEAATLTGLKDTSVSFSYCNNIDYICLLDYHSIKTNYDHIYGNTGSYELNPKLIWTHTYDNVVSNIIAPLSYIQFYYTASPYTENFIDIHDIHVRAISTLSGASYCNVGSSEEPFWCPNTSNIAYPKIYMNNIIINSTGGGISLSQYCYNSTIGFTYPQYVEIKNSYFDTGGSLSLSGQNVIVRDSTFINSSDSVGGFNNAMSIFARKATIRNNNFIGSSITDASIVIIENKSVSCIKGDKYNITVQSMLNITNQSIYTLLFNYANTKSTLYKFNKIGTLYAANQTNNQIVLDNFNIKSTYDSESLTDVNYIPSTYSATNITSGTFLTGNYVMAGNLIFNDSAGNYNKSTLFNSQGDLLLYHDTAQKYTTKWTDTGLYQVAGMITLNNDPDLYNYSACGASTKGNQAFNRTDNRFYLCNGSLGWERQITSKDFKLSNTTNNILDRCTLSSGNCTISNTKVTIDTYIFCHAQAAAGTPGSLYILNRLAGTGYNVSSTSATDTSLIACVLIEPIK